MTDHTASDISGRQSGAARCAALVGPYLSGKTTLLEAMLFACGVTSRRGSVKEGNMVGDATPEARARQMSTEINAATARYLGDAWTFLDCPGSVELVWETQNALLAADVAVVVCEPEIERALTLGPIFKFLDDHNIPHMVFINKLDTASARIRDVLAALQSISQRPLVLRQVPLRGHEDAVEGYVDLVSERAYKYKPGQPSDLIKLPDGFWDVERPTRSGLIEKLADFDDQLLEQLLEDIEPSKAGDLQPSDQGFRPRPHRAGPARRGAAGSRRPAAHEGAASRDAGAGSGGGAARRAARERYRGRDHQDLSCAA